MKNSININKFKPTIASEMSEDSMLIESNRLKTFKNWPNPNVSPSSLAKAGFFYLNQSDQVKCAYCKGSMKIFTFTFTLLFNICF